MKNNQHADIKQGIFDILIFIYEKKYKYMEKLDESKVIECFSLFTL